MTSQSESDEPIFEIVCPDGLVRHRWYDNRDAAASNAEFCTSQGCRRLYDIHPPKEMTPCPEGIHHVALVPPQGREDVIVDRPVDKTDLAILLLIVDAVKERWDSAVYEDALCDIVVYDMSAAVLGEVVDVGHMAKEFFIYRDEASLCSWGWHGATDENLDTMMHVLMGLTEITLVVSYANDSETGALAKRITQLLEKSEPLLA